MSAKNYRKATAMKIAVAAILSVAAIGGRELALKTALKPLEAPTPANANGKSGIFLQKIRNNHCFLPQILDK